MKKVVLASNNQGKLGEFRAMFTKLPLEVIPQSDLEVGEADEIGLTYIENAIIKARFASKVTGLAAIGDDSGLSVDHLGGEPGIYSARYSSDYHNAEANMEKVLEGLRDVPWESRRASFHCVLAYLQHAEDPVPIIAHGKWEGFILDAPRGSGGFGYDPIFFVPEHECGAAELSSNQKNAISHRARALANLVKQLKG